MTSTFASIRECECGFYLCSGANSNEQYANGPKTKQNRRIHRDIKAPSNQLYLTMYGTRIHDLWYVEVHM